MKTLKINNKSYEVPELDFAASKKLEQYGISMSRIVDVDIILTIVSAFVALVVGVTPDEADWLVGQHVMGGGNINTIYETYVEAVSESGFFEQLLGLKEKKETKTVKPTKTTKVETQAK